MYDFIKNFSEEDIINALYGLLLGDGYYSKGIIGIQHTDKQKFYVIGGHIFQNLKT